MRRISTLECKGTFYLQANVPFLLFYNCIYVLNLDLNLLTLSGFNNACHCLYIMKMLYNTSTDNNLVLQIIYF